MIKKLQNIYHTILLNVPVIATRVMLLGVRVRWECQSAGGKPLRAVLVNCGARPDLRLGVDRMAHVGLLYCSRSALCRLSFSVVSRHEDCVRTS